MSEFKKFIKIELLCATILAHVLGVSCTPKPPASQLVNLSPEQKIVRTKALYLMRCASCHGENGQGKIGPNLSDEYWIHGDSSKQSIARMIREGEVKKGMPAWKHLFHEDDILALAEFVMTFKNTNTNH